MAKGTPRNATVAQVILQQAEAQEPTPEKPKKGVKAGLREGDTRITCIYRDEQNQILHDFAKTTGHSFRDVCVAMADHFIEEVIRPSTEEIGKLKRNGEPPEVYADMYQDDETPDKWAHIF